jgi:hypothetical protein
MSKEMKLHLELPENFRQACADMKADPQKILQLFADHLLFVAQIATPGKDPESYAGMVLRQYMDTFQTKPVPDYRTREVNVKYIQEVLAMLRARMSPAKRQKAYGNIINQWYAELQLINN